MSARNHLGPALALLAPATLVLALAADCRADESATRPAGIELGVRANALSADPDLHGFGIAARYPVRDRWFVDATLERQFYDSRSSDVLAGRELTNVVAGLALGRHYTDFAFADWFWTWGIAAGLPDLGPATPGGGVAEVAAIEVHLTASVGLRRRFSDHWSLSGALRVERHYVDWRTTDSDGRVIREQSSLTPVGLYLALSYRF